MSLAAMLAKQKAKAEAEKANAEISKLGSGIPASANVSNGDESHRNNPVPAGGNAVAPAAAPAKLTFGVKKTANEEGRLTKISPTPTPSQSTALAKIHDDVVAAPVKSGVMTLDDLADSEDSGIAPRAEPTNPYAFNDEIPCTAPERELPEDLDKQQKEFVTTLNSIYDIMHDPDLFGGQIRIIMQEMQENPDYMKLMADQDVHVMIRGLRSSMGLAKIKKAEKTTKTRGSKKSTPATALASTADAMFNADDW